MKPRVWKDQHGWWCFRANPDEGTMLFFGWKPAIEHAINYSKRKFQEAPC